jgi:hypothetical protein
MQSEATAQDANQNTLCELNQFGTLRVSGVDAQSFLQNILSNDIREVTASRAQYSSFNSAKGRMLATFLIWQDNDDYLLQLPAGLVEVMRKKLSMYVLRAKVKITDAEVISLGLSGRLAPCEALPGLGVTRMEGAAVIRLDDARFLLGCTPEQAEIFRQMPDCQRAASGYWDWLNIRAGIPVILPQTQEQFVAQMANFDLIGGINFKKGCYPGQEIVARMHYLGKLKRRMYLAHVDSEISPQPGDEVYGADLAGQACGMIANAAAAPGGGYDVLAVIQIESRDTQTVRLAQGETLQFEELPYPLP